MTVLVFDSVTRMSAEVSGRAVIAASHGGNYAVHLALTAGVGALVVHDAGIGLERAGIAGLELAQQWGVPCAAIDHQSARIGDGMDCATRGILSFTNAAAAQLGIYTGQAAMQAAQRMAAAALRPVPPGQLPPLPAEARTVFPPQTGERPIVLVDSVSLVAPQDQGAVVLTGSHGGLQGGRPESAIRVDVFAALYNDAGLGCDKAGISRLPALDARGIAAVTVAAASAQIGSARSAWEFGILSHINQSAHARGARTGQSVRAWAQHMARQALT